MERHAAATLTRPLLLAVVSVVPDIPEVVSEQSSAAIPRQHAGHVVVGIEAQHVFEDDAGAAETPQRLAGGSDGGHVGVQASGLAVRKRATLRLTG